MIATGLANSLPADGLIMCLGAHSDDIEIGCAGTIRKFIAERPDLNFHWVVLGATGVRDAEARTSAEEILSSTKHSTLTIKSFRNGFFPYVATEIKEFFESLKDMPPPDLILTHHRDDLHQDHQLTGELTWNTFRDHLILEYEVPKFDGGLGSPNIFVTLDEAQLRAKQEHLAEHFNSQHSKQWYTNETFASLCRIRGIECNSPTGFAEAFYGRKLII